MKKLSRLITFLPILGLIIGGCATPNQPVGQQLQETSQAHYQGTDDTPSVAQVLRPALSKLEQETNVPILLPSELPSELLKQPIYVNASGSADGYTITLATQPECGANACSLGSLTATRNERPHFENTVSLAQGITGYYFPLSCGASCAPPSLEWIYQGVLYSMQLDVGTPEDPEGTKAIMIQTANSAIEGGLKRTSQTQVSNTESQLTESSKVAINGIGPIRVGMTVKEAENSADIKLIREEIGAHENCSYVKSQTGPSGVEFMVIDDRIARVNIYENPRITTVGGAKIGDTEERIKSLYPGQIEVSPHEYVPGGHYLTFVPKDAQDQQYRVVFETDGKRVTDFRAGRIPEVEYVEGCV